MFYHGKFIFHLLEGLGTCIIHQNVTKIVDLITKYISVHYLQDN